MSRSNSLPVRLIDPRGHRFGAGASVVLLAVAVVFDIPTLVAFVTVALGISALFGTRWSILGRPWPIAGPARGHRLLPGLQALRPALVGAGRLRPDHRQASGGSRLNLAD